MERWATTDSVTVLDLGGRSINGTCRDMFPNASYVSLDIMEGEGVAIVADAADWQPDCRYDVVVSTEVFEHTERWREICSTAHRALKRGGRLIVTCAGPARGAHSAVDGGPLHADEFYANVSAAALGGWLYRVGFRDVECVDIGEDVQATGVK